MRLSNIPARRPHRPAAVFRARSRGEIASRANVFGTPT
jgi:hypothetical protein